MTASTLSRLLAMASLLHLAALSSSGCGDNTGQAGISFDWESEAPVDETFFVSVEVQERPEAKEPGVVLASIPSQKFTVGTPLRLTLPSVPNGDNRRVVVELRRSPLERVSYYGVSEAFSLVAGESSRVSVAVSLQAPLADEGNNIELSYPSGAVFPGADDLCDVTVTATTANAVRIELANNASFENLERVNVQTSDKCDELTDADGYSCVHEHFQLRTDCADGKASSDVYAAYARFVDEYDYPSATLPLQVQIDATPPKAVFSALGRRVARPGARVALSVTANEAADAAFMAVTGDPGLTLVPPATEPAAGNGTTLDGTSWAWFVDVGSALPGGTTFGFEVALQDPAGNLSEFQTLLAPLGGDLTLTVDAEPPQLDDFELTVDGNEPRQAPDGTIHVRGGEEIVAVLHVSDNIGLAGELTASIAPFDASCAKEDGGTARVQSWRCALVVPGVDDPDRYEGRTAAAISEVDLAGNQIVSPSLLVQVDDTAPDISGPVNIRRGDDFASAVEFIEEEEVFEVFYKSDSRLTIVFAVDEPLPVPPSLRIGELMLGPTDFEDNALVIQFDVADQIAEGDHEMMVTLTDRAENSRSRSLGTLHADQTPPAALSPELQSQVMMYRAPHGTIDDPAPRFELRACWRQPGSETWDACEEEATGPFEPHATVIVHRVGGPDGCDPATVATGRATEGGSATVSLAVDLSSVCVSSQDRAGNTSDPVAVQLGGWVGRTRQPALETGRGMTFGEWTEVVDALTPAGESRMVDTAALDALDGTSTVLTEGAADWQRVSSPMTPLQIVRWGATLTSDSLGGGLLLGPGCKSAETQVDCTEVNEAEAPQTLVASWNGSTFTPVGGGAPGSGPRGRYAAAATFDLFSGEMLLFSGLTPGGAMDVGVMLEDMWSLSQQGWVPISREEDDSWPAGRAFSALSYDLVHREAVLFGGCSQSNNLEGSNCNGANTALGDLWLYGADGWREQLPDADPEKLWPPPRWGHAQAYDLARQETVVFGGMPANYLEPACNDEDACLTTWLWDGGSWRSHGPDDQPTSHLAYPGHRFRPAMAYDPLRERTVMWGCATNECLAADTWEWDGAGWVLAAAQGVGPPPLQGAAMAFDHISGQVVLMGGRAACFINCPTATGADVLSAAVWGWDGTWSQLYDGVSDRVDGRLTDSTGGPVSRAAPAIAKDLATNSVVVVGGTVTTSVDPFEVAHEPLDVFHTFDGTAWRSQTTSGTPPAPRAGPTGISHPDGGVLVFGGLVDGVDVNDLWHLDGGVWTQRGQTASPPIRFAPAATLHDRDVLIFGGGTAPVAAACPAGTSGTGITCSRGDTWLWDASDAWREITTGKQPGPRIAAAMAYDPSRGVTVLFGGIRTVYGAADCPDGDFKFQQCSPTDVWEFDGEVWHDKTPMSAGPDGAPAGRRSPDLFFHPGRQAVVMVGGNSPEACDGGPGPACDTVWEWNGNGWRRIFTDDFRRDGQPEVANGSVVVTTLDGAAVALTTRDLEDELGSSIGVYRFLDGMDGRPAHGLHVDRAAFFPGKDPFQVTEAAVSWYAGGFGYDASGSQVQGATLWVWSGAQWVIATNGVLPADNGAPLETPALIEWHADRTDPMLSQVGAAAPDASAHFLVTPRGTNGPGQASVSTDHVEVRLRYRIGAEADD